MERDIEVRTLDGESTVLRISPDRRVGDLKLLLRDSFPPAMSSPSFYLFFKGAKLNLESRIGSHQIEGGQFMVIVPFTKKSQQIPLQHDPIEQDFQHSTNPRGNLASAADSIWLDIMCDISSMNDISPDVLSNNVNSTQTRGEEEVSVAEKPEKRRKLSNNFCIIHDLLCSDYENIFDQQKSNKIYQLVESINCLSDPNTGKCLLHEYFDKEILGDDQCACPLWLRRVLKTFTLMNALYAFFHLQRKCMTLGFLKGALNQHNMFGLDDLCISYVEKLSLLCPEVVVVLNDEENVVTSQGSAIIIHDFSTESSNQPKVTKEPIAARRLSTSTVINAIEKRMLAFRADLWRLLKCFMENRQSTTILPSMPSLEDIITLKGSETVLGCINVKKAKSGILASRCCQGTVHLKPTEMVDHLRKGMGIFGQIIHIEEINEKMAVHVDVPDSLADVSKAALRRIGITRLYSHQAEALKFSLSGKNVVVATSTSSGKSLCYNIPVTETLSKDTEACALYIFPTKALAQDQMRALIGMTSGLNIDFNVSIYDGDTSQIHRTWIRDNSRVLITNPDMLHLSILPYHAKFQRILSNLRIIVIDEAHTYKGAFGCHTALVLRRLRRICWHVYGSNPLFIFCTATSANPREHAMELASLQNVELIQNDGSPSGAKYFLLWNPPLQLKVRTSSTGKSSNWESAPRRISPILETSHLFAEMVQHGLRCIAFCKTRKLSELVLYYTREILQETASTLADSIRVYRGGYTPQDRRRIETELFEGKLQGVAATNALELGIDVGYIDATLHLGFPGSVASLWQQAGRSGRRSRPSLAIYIAFEGPLDQYFMKFPDKLLRRSVEYCQVDSHNEMVLEQHIACAALELPVSSQYDEKYFGPCLKRAIISLKNKGHLVTDTEVSTTKIWNYVGPEVHHFKLHELDFLAAMLGVMFSINIYASQDKPSAAVSIRAIEANKYKVIDKSSNEILEEIEESKAFFQVYDGAVYMHQGGTYLIKSLELSEKIAFCQKVDLNYYTKTRDYTDIHVVGGDLAYLTAMTPEYTSRMKTTARVNACTVTTKWFGFYRIWRASNQIFDRVDLSLPSYSYSSQAAWIRVPQAIKVAVQKNNLAFRAGLHAASHALLNIVPLYMMCNTSDLGTECSNPHDTRDIPERLLLYDQHSGGIGLSLQIQRLFRELLIAALELVSTCTCLHSAGCPNCVQVLTCREYNEVLDKKAAIIILDGVIEAENSQFS